MNICTKRGRGNKIHISVDGEYVTTVDIDYWYTQSIRDSDEITQEELTALLDAVSFRRAYNKGLDLLSRRDHTKKELVQKLSKNVPNDIAIRVSEKIDSMGLINEENYARIYADELVRRKGMSAFRVKQELLKRGIDRETSDYVVSQLDTDSKECIINLLNTKFAYRNLENEKELKRTINALIRLGYQYGEIKSALEEQGIYNND